MACFFIKASPLRLRQATAAPTEGARCAARLRAAASAADPAARRAVGSFYSSGHMLVPGSQARQNLCRANLRAPGRKLVSGGSDSGWVGPVGEVWAVRARGGPGTHW